MYNSSSWPPNTFSDSRNSSEYQETFGQEISLRHESPSSEVIHKLKTERTTSSGVQNTVTLRQLAYLRTCLFEIRPLTRSSSHRQKPEENTGDTRERIEI